MPKNLDKKNLITCMSFVYWLRLIYSFIKKKHPNLRRVGCYTFLLFELFKQPQNSI
jgi:hypothetical protein